MDKPEPVKQRPRLPNPPRVYPKLTKRADDLVDAFYDALPPKPNSMQETPWDDPENPWVKYDQTKKKDR